ncbi:HAD hydrolase-like protein [Georgenia sp. 10Sc9-8]|uniref:HAD hydrolase-like protein n=1 Tax=Georgenia halotolerans TaxID=3028317 RepID=A0ABT5U198_9MICO|nr:HAD hydrolase-like protein [Georgenia halotolerans]
MSDASQATLRPTAVLLDLDGTITDSAPVITGSIAEALAAHGYPVPPAPELLRFVGPPIRMGLMQVGGVAEDEVPEVVATYRSLYARHMHDVDVYPGMRELIADLHGAGVPLAVATSKMRAFAVDILQHAGLAAAFTVICGASADESRSAKADVVADALTGLRQAGVDVSGAVMVGDRHHDVDGAAAHGLPTLLVAWGYAQPGEAAGAHAVVHDADALRALLGGPAPRA